MKQFLVLLFDCVPNMKHVWSTDKLLKSAKILKSETCKNAATAFCSVTTKPEKLFDEKKILKMLK